MLTNQVLSKIYLNEKEWLITDDSEIVKYFKQYFSKIVPDLDLMYQMFWFIIVQKLKILFWMQ